MPIARGLIGPSFCCAVVWSLGWVASTFADVTLIGTAEISGTTSDRSGLTEMLNDSIPANRFGGISAIEHVAGEEYLVQPDRGPLDGAVPFACRNQRMRVIDPCHKHQRAIVKRAMIPMRLQRRHEFFIVAFIICWLTRI